MIAFPPLCGPVIKLKSLPRNLLQVCFHSGLKFNLPNFTETMLREMSPLPPAEIAQQLLKLCEEDGHTRRMFSPAPPRAIGSAEAELLRWLNSLLKFLPPNTVDWVKHLVLNTHPCLVQAVSARDSKHGDHRPGRNGAPNMVTISISGNAYQQFITTIHELAHNEVSLRFSNVPVEPHGPEWQLAFQRLLDEALHRGLFPGPLAQAVRNYARCPKASSSRDESLQTALRAHDTADTRPMVSTLPLGTWFSLDGKLYLQKGDRVRTSFRCTTNDGRVYRVSPVARVSYLAK